VRHLAHLIPPNLRTAVRNMLADGLSMTLVLDALVRALTCSPHFAAHLELVLAASSIKEEEARAALDAKIEAVRKASADRASVVDSSSLRTVPLPRSLLARLR
jgi:hypothetical protein